MFNTITKKHMVRKLGLILSASLILVSAFSGIAIAKPQAEEQKNQKLYATVAATMSVAEDPAQAFKSMEQKTQDKIQSQLQIHFKNMEAIVENGGEEKELQEYIKTIPESIAFIIEVDFTYKEYETKTDAEEEHVCAYSSHNDDSALADEVYTKNSLSCPSTCSKIVQDFQLCRGSVSGAVHWKMAVWFSVGHDAYGINMSTADGFEGTGTYIEVYNGWRLKNLSAAQDNVAVITKAHKDNNSNLPVVFAANTISATFTHLFDTEQGDLSVGMMFDDVTQ